MVMQATGSQAAQNARDAPRLSSAAFAWAGYQGARDPYIILVTIYILAPYISTVVIGDPVEGQALFSEWSKVAAWIAALTAPIMGAAADRAGARKPVLALVTIAMAPLIFSLWFATPGPGGLSIALIGLVFTAMGVLIAWSEVLHNAMLTAQGGEREVPYISGLGLAAGNAASVLLLVVVLTTIALPGQIDLPFLPDAPLWGLDPATHETSRIVAPLAAVWLAVFSLPLFFLAKDGARGAISWLAAGRQGVSGVFGTIGKLKRMPNVALFLAARMLYFDGKVAILVIGGVFAAGVNNWGLVEMTAYGVLLSAFAVGGGLLAGPLDHALGAKRALVLEIAVTIGCLSLLAGTSAERIMFVFPVSAAPVWNAPLFETASELVYLAVACVVAVSITACFASSRTLMVQLSPRGMEGELFGLYALAGTATAWAGPMLVEHFTRTYQSQQIGFLSIGILLVAGLVVLLFVKPARAAQTP
jgi:UMF1 family MFS transporter